ncbi:hypothetical protein O181_094683 [Austropuccinia psidii MF-1]|uniref:Reverse transcriptase RNase H-like domain-containing protein n=1 Tax=Austropuccinia psidii MF-1 TaxID=1389203 RepID=A0A9Q3J3L9_9BASI|nr:hypothetical protein [Austropuccinia psidii MF-1]
MFLVWNIWVMLFLLKASRWTKQKSSRFSIGHLQETSRLFKLSLALPISTSVSSRIDQRKSVHSPVSSRKIPVFSSMRKLSISFSNSERLSPPSQSFSTHHSELNHEIHDKELLGIVWALKWWRAFPVSLPSPFEVLTNHSSLQYFIYSKVLACRKARRAEFLLEYHFSITYFPGRLATLPDALSRWDNVYPQRGRISEVRAQ